MEHLQFKGIPIDGNIDDFANQLELSGFILSGKFENIYAFTGQFVTKDVELYVYCTSKTQKVWKVAIYLPAIGSWFNLKDECEYFKNQFSIKYGMPTDQFNFFIEPYFEGDGYELQAFDQEKAIFSSYWTIHNGTVVVDISKSGQVRLCYEDAENAEIMDKEKDCVVLDEI